MLLALKAPAVARTGRQGAGDAPLASHDQTIGRGSDILAYESNGANMSPSSSSRPGMSPAVKTRFLR